MLFDPVWIGGRMPVVDVMLVDPEDEDLFDRWFGVVTAAHEVLWPDAPGWQRAELLASARDTTGPVATIDLAARRGDGTVVGAASVELPRVDNLHLGEVTVNVHPHAVRGGVGSALLAAAEVIVRGDGRSLSVSFQDEPVRLAGRSPGRQFALDRGYALAQVARRREIALPVDDALLDRLEAASLPKARGYRIEGWEGAWPDALIEDRLELGRRMSTDAPWGELDRREEHWDEVRLRGLEALLEAQHRRLFSTVAVEEASGRLVAFSQIVVPSGAPEMAYQHDTLVLAEHRGHRLGTLVKIANLGALAGQSPRTRVVATYNASENAPMARVNEALGFVVVADANTWHKPLG